MRSRRIRNQRLQMRRKRFLPKLIIVILAVALLLLVGNLIAGFIHDNFSTEYWAKEDEDIKVEIPDIDVQLLTPNEYSRPKIETSRIKNIVIHYVANPRSTAQMNRDYFEGLKDSQLTSASSHFIVGLEGEIIQCIPTTEVAYASNEANGYSVSIEVCHPDATGEFSEITYESVVELTAYLCEKFNLDADDIIRHYDITGKMCPLYYVENEEEWEQLRADVDEVVGKNWF